MFDKIRQMYVTYQTKKQAKELEAFATKHNLTSSQVKSVFKRINVTANIPIVTPQYPST